MRLSPASIVLGCLVFLPAADAPTDEAHALLERAIEAHGGEARIARTKRGRLTAKVEMTSPATGTVKATWEEVFDLPGRNRRTIERTNAGETFREEYAVNGSKGWTRQGQNAAHEFPVSEALFVEPPWHAFLSQLLLLRDKNIRLTVLGEEQQGGRTLVGIRAVSRQGTDELYFDKSTGLTACARRPIPNLMGGGEIVGETRYGDYRTVSGVRYPMHIRVRDGAGQHMDLTVISLDFLDRIDASAFAKPPAPEAPSPHAGGSEETPHDGGSSAATPGRRDARLIAATLAGGILVGGVWLLIRFSRRKRETPAP